MIALPTPSTLLRCLRDGDTLCSIVRTTLDHSTLSTHRHTSASFVSVPASASSSVSAAATLHSLQHHVRMLRAAVTLPPGLLDGGHCIHLPFMSHPFSTPGGAVTWCQSPVRCLSCDGTRSAHSSGGGPVKITSFQIPFAPLRHRHASPPPSHQGLYQVNRLPGLQFVI